MRTGLRFRFWIVTALVCAGANTGVLRAETWAPFCQMLEGCDYVAQYQELVRDGEVVGRRLVRVYWIDEAKAARLPLPKDLPWKLADFKPATDRAETVFEFQGRGQHLWTVSPDRDRGLGLYRGGSAVAGSAPEFHEWLLRAAELQKAGKKLAGNLELPVLGEMHKSD